MRARPYCIDGRCHLPCAQAACVRAVRLADQRFAQLRHHNVFLASSDAWDDLFSATSFSTWDAKMAQAPRHFYVHAPARTDPSVTEVPTDDAIMVLVPVPPLDESLPEDAVESVTARIVECAREERDDVVKEYWHAQAAISAAGSSAERVLPTLLLPLLRR